MTASKNTLNPFLKKQIKKTLAQTIADIKTLREARLFLSDFLSRSEYEMLAKRLATSYWLKKGRSYNNIKNNVKVSSATIASTQKAMTKPGFKLALKKIEAEEWASKWSEKFKKLIG